MHDFSAAENWRTFLRYMEPCIKYLEPEHVVKYIVAKTGKRTLVIGVDESLSCKEERFKSFFEHLELLALCNSTAASVFVFASSLSALEIRDGWENLVRPDEKMHSAIDLRELPLTLLQDHVVGNDALLLRFKSNPDLAPALALAGGHPRAIGFLVHELSGYPHAALASLVRQ